MYAAYTGNIVKRSENIMNVESSTPNFIKIQECVRIVNIVEQFEELLFLVIGSSFF